MKLRDKATLIATTIVSALPILAYINFYERLPEQMPVHFDINWNPDGYMQKSMAVLIIPLTLLAVNIFLHFMLDNEPKKQNMPKPLIMFSKWIVPVMSVVVNGGILAYALGVKTNLNFLILGFLGLLFSGLGILLPKCKQNYTMGIRLPWTLNNEENWDRTHKLAGHIWLISGISIVFFGLLGFTYAVIAIIAIMVLIPMIYSYLLYKKEV